MGHVLPPRKEASSANPRPTGVLTLEGHGRLEWVSKSVNLIRTNAVA